ncbi:MAG: helix-turn-helix domain-containing protein [Pseudomonadota bacterium]
MTLVNHLSELRRARQMTQAQLAEAAGVSRKTINTIERRVFVPSTVLALRLSNILGVSVHEIFELEEEEEDKEEDGDDRVHGTDAGAA